MPTSTKTKIKLLAIIALLVAGSLINFINQFNSQSIFSMFNTIQLIVLIPMIGAYLPLDVAQFIAGLSFSLLNFQLIGLNSLLIPSIIKNSVSYDQPDNYLQLLSINDGSTIINIYSSIGVSLIIPWLHMLFWILSWFWIKTDNLNCCK